MRTTKKIALASLCAALGVVCLSIGMLLDVMDMTAALLASFLVLFCLMEMGYGYAFLVFCVISALSLILLPSASVSWMFLLLFGYMPIAKFGLERVFRKFAWLPKLILFNAVYAAMIFLLGGVFGFTAENSFGIPVQIVYAAFFAVGNLMYLLCDILYGRLVRIYMARFRERIRRHLK